jgi:uncharacterized protein (DUF1499 family)
VNYVWTVLAVLAAAGVVLVAYVRLAPSNPAVWHVDPDAVPDPATPNFARADLVIPLPPAEVAARLEAAAQVDGAVQLAGDAALATWLTRSPLMRFPDYTSIKLTPADGGTRLSALARARFGSRDMGANRARLNRWVAAAQGAVESR